MTPQIPASLQGEHDLIRATLKRAMREPGATGDAARAVTEVLEGHMLLEEKFAFRPLGLLRALARGDTPSELSEALKLADGLRREMAALRAEHEQIASALRRLSQEAQAEGKIEYVSLAEELLRHQRLEEEVIYPAALVVGELIRKIRREPAAPQAA